RPLVLARPLIDAKPLVLARPFVLARPLVLASPADSSAPVSAHRSAQAATGSAADMPRIRVERPVVSALVGMLTEKAPGVPAPDAPRMRRGCANDAQMTGRHDPDVAQICAIRETQLSRIAQR